MRKIILLVYLCVLSLSFVNMAMGTTITGLYNTGVDNAGNILSSGIADPHYIMRNDLMGSSGITALSMGQDPNAWPWRWTHASNAGWIGPNTGSVQNRELYIYETTFYVDGVDNNTHLTGYLAVDDAMSVYINGTLVTSYGGFNSLQPFNITSGFVEGLNTLQFHVVDTGRVITGLLISNYTGSGFIPPTTAIPEPATVILFISSFACLIFHKRKK